MEFYNTTDLRGNETLYLGSLMSNFIEMKYKVNEMMYNDQSRVDFLLKCLQLDPNLITIYSSVDKTKTVDFIKNLEGERKKALIILIQGLFPQNSPKENIVKLFPLFEKANIDISEPLNIEPYINLKRMLFMSELHYRIEGKDSDFENSYDVLRYLITFEEENNLYGFTVANEEQQNVIQPKIMKILYSNDEETILRGYGSDENGFSYCGYGITIQHSNMEIKRIFYHWYDRNITIEYIGEQLET